MADYYIDLDNPAAWSTRDGTDHTGNEWLGLSGLQKAADTVTAGNTIYIKGTVVCTTLKNVTYDNLSGTFTVGEEVQIDVSNKGIVSEDTGSILTVEVTAGVFANDDTMTGQTSGATADVNVTVAVKPTGVDLVTNSGDVTNGFIKFIGVNSSWVDDETRAKLDGNSGTVAGCLDIFSTASATTGGLFFKNIEVDDADDRGFDLLYSDENIFINCWAHDCDDRGWKVDRDNIFIRCISTNNDYGFDASYSGRHIGCIAHTNTHYGFTTTGPGGIFIGCISAKNGRGMYMYQTQSVLFCTVDENVDGIYVGYLKNHVFVSNRITNQSDDGIVVASGTSCYEDWNLLYGNAGDNYDDTAGAGLIEKGGNSKINSTGDGYTDQTNHDFNLTDSADYRREAITLPKWDGTSP